MNSRIRLLKKLVPALAFLSAASCVSQPVLPPGPGGDHPERELLERVHSREELAVLFVGNSYSFGVPRAFSRLAAENGRKVRVGREAVNGWSLRKHSLNQPTLDDIRGGNWDVVVLQEYSEIPAMNPRARAAAMFPPLRKLVSEVRAAGAVPVLYQTWGSRAGSRWKGGDSFQAMTSRLREGYRAASENAGHLVVVPVGDAWEREMAAGRADGLFMKDGRHPAPFGDRVTAGAFYQTFFGK